jgi:hypothetical protein
MVVARRKQGGSQSANDSAKGPAKSAGALLRRYGEQALRDVCPEFNYPLINSCLIQDIRGLLETWDEEIAQCERIWIRASISNRRIFYDYGSAPWAKKDIRLRTFPFPTRRPVRQLVLDCCFLCSDKYLSLDAVRAPPLPDRINTSQDLTFHRRRASCPRPSLPCITPKAQTCASSHSVWIRQGEAT